MDKLYRDLQRVPLRCSVSYGGFHFWGVFVILILDIGGLNGNAGFWAATCSTSIPYNMQVFWG
jgi:hypothetical protein